MHIEMQRKCNKSKSDIYIEIWKQRTLMEWFTT